MTSAPHLVTANMSVKMCLWVGAVGLLSAVALSHFVVLLIFATQCYTSPSSLHMAFLLLLAFLRKMVYVQICHICGILKYSQCARARTDSMICHVAPL